MDHKGRQMADELSILELRGLLRLRAKETYVWLTRHCPAEAIRRQGRCLYIATWGVNAALARCKWQPRSPKGYQGCPGRVPLNVHCRDDLGRFVSHRVSPRPPRHVAPRVYCRDALGKFTSSHRTPKQFVHPERRRYLRSTGQPSN